jgi:hypothetical protein
LLATHKDFVMLSESLRSRESLKLSFNRSISEPGRTGLGGVLSLAPMMSPPSLAPNLHPPKRCKLEASEASAAARGGSGALPSGGFLAPPPTAASGTMSLPTSPCSESSSLQRSLVIQKTKTISADGLADRLHSRGKQNGAKSSLLLLDCRPFIAYNVCHVRGAINVNCCDRFNRKRLQQGKASLADLATTKEAKELLKKRNWKEVVVYDDGSEELASLPSSHTLFLVIASLVEDLRQPVMLVGGLRCFQVLTYLPASKFFQILHF